MFYKGSLVCHVPIRETPTPPCFLLHGQLSVLLCQLLLQFLSLLLRLSLQKKASCCLCHTTPIPLSLSLLLLVLQNLHKEKMAGQKWIDLIPVPVLDYSKTRPHSDILGVYLLFNVLQGTAIGLKYGHSMLHYTVTVPKFIVMHATVTLLSSL